MPLSADAWVPLAEVARPHGVRGEIRLRPFNRDSDLLLERDEVLLRFEGGQQRAERVEAARRANDAVLVKLASISDRTAAEALRGALVCVRRGDFPPAAEGEFYVCDLEGARVLVEQADGAPRELGRVRAVQAYPAADVLVVDAADGGSPWEVPLLAHVVRAVDVASGTVTLATVEGVERG
ncbi:MAG TPA: ribosome maturation factor RimM [Polyangiaceae bacterium]|nr:ribosome maturation factor RimM [Polyangiaceae bacterium]